MPIYEYISEHPEDPHRSCAMCRKGFELMRPADREPLTRCMYCKNPVRKKIGNVNVPKITAPLSITDAKKAGFTVLQRRDEGTFEKL
ncbi:MAG: zinc ribbon domain-containing protein [Akkermansia sp.]|mgnify:FL=1|nr:zinc ribbon domain-containing protein [Akkermansia sp.]MDO4818564.1 zinc ribbon domain-containing protein [Akkermansia sp.]MDO4953578.1 zinc ribbon domain-containing protein [Akkermansia sp.]